MIDGTSCLGRIFRGKEKQGEHCCVFCRREVTPYHTLLFAGEKAICYDLVGGTQFVSIMKVKSNA